MAASDEPETESGDAEPEGIRGEFTAAPRRENRRGVDMDAGLRRPGSGTSEVHVRDLSANGFRIETWMVLSPGDDVWLKLPGIENLPAKVAWVRGHEIGCKFEKPLHGAVLDMVVGKSR